MSTRLNHIRPPQAPEIELRAIGALITLGDPDNIRVQQAMLKLDEECFFTPNHRILFKLIQEFFKLQHKFDFVSLITKVPNGIYELVDRLVHGDYCSINNLAYDVEQLLTYRAWRKQLVILTNAVNESLDALTPAESLTVISEKLQEITRASNTSRKSYLRTYETIADEFLSQDTIDDSEVQIDIPGLPPVPNRALIIIAGRSGHGKTFFGIHMMDKLIDAIPAKQSLYFNLEMDERVMLERHATLLGIRGNSRKEKISNGIGLLLPKNVSLISEPMITIDEIETESRLAAMRQPIAVIVVDYLGLIGTKKRSESKYLDQTDIAKRLAALSLELNCRVIGLIQVNRESKTRQVGDRCPVPSDAADSMGSVHSASWWIGIDQPQLDSNDPQWIDQYMIACRKNRGEAGLFDLLLKFKYGMFSKWVRPFSATVKHEPSGF